MQDNTRFVFNNQYWEVTNTKGLKYIYGLSTTLRDPNNTTVKWYLDKIVDPFGNSVNYYYNNSGHQISIMAITYGGNDDTGLVPQFKIDFATESRTDTSTSYRYNVMENINNRLNLITISANNNLIKSYQLLYNADSSTPDSTKASTLHSIAEVSSNNDSLPLATFDYTQAPAVSANFSTWATISNHIGDQANYQDPTRYLIADVNGDGLADIVYIDNDNPAKIYVALATASGFEPFQPWQTLGNGVPSQYRIADVNGDGKTDLIYFHGPGDGLASDVVCLSNGTKFENCANISSPAEGAQYYQFLIADFTGDGKKDIVHLDANNGNMNVAASANTESVSFSPYSNWMPIAGFGIPSPSNFFYGDFNGDGKTDTAYKGFLCNQQNYCAGFFYVFTSTGSGFGPADGSADPSNTDSYLWGVFGDNFFGAYRVADFNGDGKSDLLWIDEYGKLAIALSTGKGFVGANGYPASMPVAAYADASNYYWGRLGASANVTGSYLVGDFNGDGKADLMMVGAGANGGTAGDLYVALSTGSKFVGQNGNSDWTTNSNDFYWGHLGDGTLGRYKIGDFNGDGASDVMFIDQNGNITVLASGDRFNILLNSIQTRQGGTTTIIYAPSTNYANTQLPFALPVVSKVTVDDVNPLKQSQGGGSTSTYSISYSGGYYSFSQREYRGFSQVTVDGPSGPNGERGTTTMWFHQGNSRLADVADDLTVADAFMRGKPYRIRLADATGSGYVERIINYKDSIQLPHFNPPEGITVNDCLNATTCKTSKAFYQYDDYGNAVRLEVQPDIDDTAGTYNKTIVRSFNPNTSAWIISLPSSETTYQGIGVNLTQKAETDYFYDAATSCQSAVPTTPTIPTQGKVTGIRYWLQNGISPEVTMAYDTYGNKLCEKDPRTDKTLITTYTYDSVFHAYLKEIQRPANKIPSTKFTYYGVDVSLTGTGLFGQLKDTIDANGNMTTLQYDPFGRMARTDYPDHSWEQTTYTDYSAISCTSPSGSKAVCKPVAGPIPPNIRVDNSAGLWSVNYFDGMNKTYTVESSGPDSKTIVTNAVYDARNKLWKSSFPYFKSVESPVWITLTRDYRGRVIAKTKPGSKGDVTAQTCYGLSTVDRIDENSHARRQILNGLGLVAEVDEFSGTYINCASVSPPTNYPQTFYGYDVMGRLANVTDAKQNNTIIKYDFLGRKQSMTDPDMGTWGYTYYPNGLLWTQTDAKGQTIAYDYDELNRPSKKHYPSGTDTDVTFTYDEPTSTNANGRLTTMTDGSGYTVYNYDAMGRISIINKNVNDARYPLTAQLAFGYVNGRLDNITYPDNEVISYDYNGPFLHHVIGYVSYDNYDAFGRPANAAYGAGGASSLYVYDPITKWLNSLTVTSPPQETSSGITPSKPLVDNIYGYDNKGNITSITDTLNTPLPTNFTGETYVPARAHAVDHTSSGRQFQYDNNGNMTSDGTRNIIYNSDNMPVAVNNTVYSYDGTGTRVKKKIGNSTTAYINKLYECTNGTCSKFIFAGGNRVAIKTNTVALYYHPNHQGSTVAVTNATGGSEETIAYYPFGGTRQDRGAVINLKHKYTGQELDQESGLYNYNARLYDPDLGRFITPDSIVPNPGNPQSLNRYAYVRNNPITRIDPTGHDDDGGESAPADPPSEEQSASSEADEAVDNSEKQNVAFTDFKNGIRDGSFTIATDAEVKESSLQDLINFNKELDDTNQQQHDKQNNTNNNNDEISNTDKVGVLATTVDLVRSLNSLSKDPSVVASIAVAGVSSDLVSMFSPNATNSPLVNSSIGVFASGVGLAIAFGTDDPVGIAINTTSFAISVYDVSSALRNK